MKPLGQDISMSELQSMVDQGMKRGEICKALGISYNTLRRYLGPKYKRRQPEQPEQAPAQVLPLPERLRREVQEGKRKPPQAQPVQAAKRFTRTETHTVTLNGDYASYEIDMIGRTVRIRAQIFDQAPLTAQDFRAVVLEMQTVQQELGTLCEFGTFGAMES